MREKQTERDGERQSGERKREKEREREKERRTDTHTHTHTRTDVGHLQRVKWGRAGRHVIWPQHRRLPPDRPRPVARARPIRRADVDAAADEARVQALRARPGVGGQPHHRARAGEARHLVAAHRLVELASVGGGA